MSKFDVQVAYVPGKDNVVPDALSRWAYPASRAFADSSIHGSDKDDEQMRAIIEEERKEERTCRYLYVNEVLASLREGVMTTVAVVPAKKRKVTKEEKD